MPIGRRLCGTDKPRAGHPQSGRARRPADTALLCSPFTNQSQASDLSNEPLRTSLPVAHLRLRTLAQAPASTPGLRQPRLPTTHTWCPHPMPGRKATKQVVRDRCRACHIACALPVPATALRCGARTGSDPAVGSAAGQATAPPWPPPAARTRPVSAVRQAVPAGPRGVKRVTQALLGEVSLSLHCRSQALPRFYEPNLNDPSLLSSPSKTTGQVHQLQDLKHATQRTPAVIITLHRPQNEASSPWPRPRSAYSQAPVRTTDACQVAACQAQHGKRRLDLVPSPRRVCRGKLTAL